jgi:hypothetical protein
MWSRMCGGGISFRSPYFVLYGLHADLMVFGALIPSASDPLTWLDRFSKPS